MDLYRFLLHFCCLSLLFVPLTNAKEGSAPPYSLKLAKQCEAKLRSSGARFKVLKSIDGPGECGSPRPLKLISLRGNIKLTEKVVLRCQAALALSRWVNRVVKPSAKKLVKAKLKKLNIANTYECRRRNNSPKGPLSEHAFANGIDLMGIDFRGIREVKIGNPRYKRFQKKIRKGACKYFTTVIGPGTNAAHKNHLHLDLAIRNNGYRLCE